jgi:hypothetical protein
VDIKGQKRRRLVIWSRALWIPSLVVAGVSFTYNWIIVASAETSWHPWSAPLVPGIIIFVVSMLTLNTGMVLRRVAARPSGTQQAVWVAAWIGWCGVLLFGIGWAGSSMYDDWGFGGGEVLATMFLVGALAVVIAVCVFLFSLLIMRADKNASESGT